MPDYEIRFFHDDGTLAVVHVSYHESDEEAHNHARRMKSDHARYELHRAGERLLERQR
ncbi:MAG: hypothetical protein WDM91_12955 [Rhizomicrobium sp.]